MDVAAALALHAREVEAELDRLLPPETVEPAVIHRAMRYCLFGGGKRLRPALCLAACEAVSGVAADVMPVAAALEMIHTYSLVHDDLPCMDDDDLRRGRPTCHRVFGDAIAVLTGDALLTHAFAVLGRWAAARPDAARAARAIGEIATAAGSLGMVGGQVLDIEGVSPESGLVGLERVHRLKTGALIAASVRSGALAGGAGDTALAALDRYARQFGLAFQIADDVLDVVGQTEKIGKPAGSDERNQKPTYASLAGVDGAREMAGATARAAIDALASFGAEADFLRGLARFAVEREF